LASKARRHAKELIQQVIKRKADFKIALKPSFGMFVTWVLILCMPWKMLWTFIRPFSDEEVFVCLYEISKQNIYETLIPLLSSAGEPEEYDFE